MWCFGRQLLVAAEILTCLGVVVIVDNGLMPYSVTQYISGGLVMFISAELLEGVNLLLLSNVMSSRLAWGTYNGGLLSTEASTVAHVVADGTITLTGYFGKSKLLNLTMWPTLVMGLQSIAGVLAGYHCILESGDAANKFTPWAVWSQHSIPLMNPQNMKLRLSSIGMEGFRGFTHLHKLDFYDGIFQD